MNVVNRISWVRVLAVAAVCGMIAGPAWADGTETLGAPGIAIASGSGIVAGGTGLVTQPGTIELNVPEGATINQVLLYWTGELRQTDDDTVLVNGVEVTGSLIGGPAFFFNYQGQVHVSAYRADITTLGLVTAGANVLDIEGLNYDWDNTGAGIMVIYDDGATVANLQIVDGVDLAYYGFPNPRRDTVPQTFTVPAADEDRTAELTIFTGDLDEEDQTSIEITVGGTTTTLENVLVGADGPSWDTLIVPVEIPAGETEVTVQIVSVQSSNPPGGSVIWVAAALSLVTDTGDDTCVECEDGVTQLTLRYTGRRSNASVYVYAIERWRPIELFDGRLDPDETFTIGDGVEELPRDIFIVVKHRFNAWIRTDCRWPVGPGSTYGDFVVDSALTAGGAEICPFEQPYDYCDEGRPEVLTLRYTGEECNRGRGCHGGNWCWGDPEHADPVYIIATDEWHPYSPDAKIYFEGYVNLGDTFDVDAAVANASRLGHKTWIYVFKQQPEQWCHSRDLLQIVKIETSCRRPISEGSKYGSLELVDYVAD